MSVVIGGDAAAEVAAVEEAWASRVTPLTVPGGTGFKQLYGRPCRIVGWSVRETSGTTAAGFDLVDGPATGNQLLATVALAAGASSVQWFGHPGPASVVQLNVDYRAGAVTGVVYVEDVGP